MKILSILRPALLCVGVYLIAYCAAHDGNQMLQALIGGGCLGCFTGTLN